MKLSNFHKVETNEAKEAILGVAQDLKKIASKENITEGQKQAVNDAIMIAKQTAENFDKLDKETIKSSMNRCAKLVEAAFSEDIAPNFRDNKENQINKLKPVAPRAIDGGKVLLSLYPENNGMYNNEETKTCSPVAVTRVAEMIVRDLTKRLYPSAQEAYDGYCSPKGPYIYASAQEKVKLGVLLQNYGFAINYDKFEKEAKKDKEAYLKQEKDKKDFAKGDNQTKKVKAQAEDSVTIPEDATPRDSGFSRTDNGLNEFGEQNYPCWVSAYHKSLGYGGAEEGGWWYTDYDLLDSVRIQSADEAKQKVEELWQKFESQNDPQQMSNVNSGGKVFITTEDDQGAQNQGRPAYSSKKAKVIEAQVDLNNMQNTHGECDNCHNDDKALWIDYRQPGDFAFCKECWQKVWKNMGDKLVEIGYPPDSVWNLSIEEMTDALNQREGKKKVMLSSFQKKAQASGITNAYCSCGGDHGAGGGTTKHKILTDGSLECLRCTSVKNPAKPKKKAQSIDKKIEALCKKGLSKDQARAYCIAQIGGLQDNTNYAPDTSNSSLLDRIAEKVMNWWGETQQPVNQAKVVELANSVDPSAAQDPQTLMYFLANKLGENIVEFKGGEAVDYKERRDDSFGNWTGSNKQASMLCQGCGYTMADMVKTGNEDMCPKCGNKMVVANENFSNSNQQMLATEPMDNSTSLLDKYLHKETISTQNQLGGSTVGNKKEAAINPTGWDFRIVRKAETNEWVVKAYYNGKYDEESTYYTDDKQDAVDTMKAMIEHAKLYPSNPNDRRDILDPSESINSGNMNNHPDPDASSFNFDPLNGNKK